MAGRSITDPANPLVWALCCYGVTLIITGSHLLSGARRAISEQSRALGKLVTCPMCTGFWVGALLALVPYSVVATGSHVLDVVLSGAASSAVCFIAHVVLARLGAEDL